MLTEEQHDLVTALQRRAGLHNPETLADMTALENIAANVRILQQAGIDVPDEALRTLTAETLRHADGAGALEDVSRVTLDAVEVTRR